MWNRGTLMKKATKDRWTLVTIGALLLVGSFALPVSVQPTADTSLTISVDALDVDSGLDPRDAMGRPRADFHAREQLRQMFISGLFTLLMRPELPRRAELLSALERLWNAAGQAMNRVKTLAVLFLSEVWLPVVRRMILLVTCLFGGILLFRPCRTGFRCRLFSFQESFLSTCLTSVVLRC